ncbi:MAG TPA: CTP synthase [Erysipelothrix sp.]|nr:CTP synthase [Erysipelothrix sp.]
MSKYVFITGGVVSGIGKGIVATSLGRLLKNRGLKVFLQKFDPYINFDPGTMSPYQHGEVFVTKDGAETDLDIGHYERFIDEELTQNANITTGRVYMNVIDKERRGEYNGATVQVVPHITDEIKQKIYDASKEYEADVVITEIGGTVGDIESLPFIEAVRQFHGEHEKDDVVIIHTALVPEIPGSDELKTKPIQHSYKQLMSLGVKPNMIVTRSNSKIDQEIRKKIAMFCDVREHAIIESPNVENIYELPIILNRQGLDDYVVHKLNLDVRPAEMHEWNEMVFKQQHLSHKVKIALVGKYVQLHDAYLSVVESLKHAGLAHDSEVEIDWVNSEILNPENIDEYLKNVDGIIVPGGFGARGTNGKILASKYARENKIPFFGISMGMQTAIIDIARELAGLEGANSPEFDENTPHPIFSLMENHDGEEVLGGTLRLGDYPCQLVEGSKVHALYQETDIVERHRHRYELNNDYREVLEKAGIDFVGLSPDESLIEIFELRDYPFFVACQFHPEFKSRPNRAHPLFKGLIEASIQNKLSKQ